MSDPLAWLQTYYQSLCDGEWERQYGFKIENVGNPGWLVEFDLIYTEMEDFHFDAVRIERSETDWVFCDIRDKVFQGSCGATNLVELLAIFRNWVEANALPRSSEN